MKSYNTFNLLSKNFIFTMMIIGVILSGYVMTCVCADGVADLVLSCSLVGEGAGLDGVESDGPLGRTPATLVLRDVAVGPDESLETLTPFVAPSVPDPDLIIFEAKASSPEIPNADMLLHADCNELEVMCEISRYSTTALQESSDVAFFMVTVTVEAEKISTSLILQITRETKDHSTLVQNKLNLPLSHSGTLLSEVIFLVFSNVNSASARLSEEVLISCGFKQQEEPLAQEVAIEWRLQHRGKGRKVLEMKTKLDDTEGNTLVRSDRKDSSVDVAGVLTEGNASLTLNKLRVSDEGTYICTVSIGHFQAQQVVRLHPFQPPQVSLSREKLLQAHQRLSCHCSKYYPLDSQMEWFYASPTDTELQPFGDPAALSSHRQHGDGTYSLSSHITVPPTFPPGTTITCRVTHRALDSPLDTSAVVEGPEPDSYWWVGGFLFITVLFFYQVMK